MSLNSCILILITVIGIKTASGQDIIHKRNDSLIDCQIIGMNTSGIEFYTGQPGAKRRYSANLNEIFSFRFNHVDYRVNDSLIKTINTIPINPFFASDEYWFFDSIVNSNAHFVYNHTGSSGFYRHSNAIVYVDDIVLRTKNNGNSYLLLNNETKIDLSSVKFFKKMGGFYANANEKGIRGNNVVKIMEKGKVNIYDGVTYHFGDYLPTVNGISGVVTVPVVYGTGGYYYNFGFGNLKKVSYNSLLNDLWDNKASLDFLKQYRQFKRKSITTTLMGIGMMAGGMLYFATSDDSYYPGSWQGVKRDAITVVSVFTGSALITVGIVLNFYKKGFLMDALYEYNSK